MDISSIRLPEIFNTYFDTNNQQLQELSGIAKLNIFVGANNSGKSRFMRMISMMKSYDIHIQNSELEAARESIIDSLKRIVEQFNKFSITSVGKISIEFINGKIIPPHYLNLSHDAFTEYRDFFVEWSNLKDFGNWSGKSPSSLDTHVKREITNCINQASKDAIEALDLIPKLSEDDDPLKRYIPVLRGLRPLDVEQLDLYKNRTESDYFGRSSDYPTPTIFTGLTFYEILTNQLLGENSERKRIQEYQGFISASLFEGKEVTLIPNLKSKVVVVKIGNEKERPIYELGDGIQTALVLSFLPFITEQSTFFFIEEPETHLHPGLQRKLINLFFDCKQHYYFITTHSNHLLDITCDYNNVSIFTFRKRLDSLDSDEIIPTFTVELIDARDRSSLNLLGVRNSSVFLVNATIWVEGITDRWYLRKMLSAYINHLEGVGKLDIRIEEDVHYSFVEYGGSNITHWSFLDYEDHPIEVERLCARAMVVIDKDGERKLKRKDDLQRLLGNRLQILPVREIENALPYCVIEKVILEYEKTPNRKLKKHPQTTYKSRYLGKFIEEKILENTFTRKGGYASDSGTIKNKVNFCEKALGKITYNDLSTDIQEVVQNIYNFILENNPI